MALHTDARLIRGYEFSRRDSRRAAAGIDVSDVRKLFAHTRQNYFWFEMHLAAGRKKNTLLLSLVPAYQGYRCQIISGESHLEFQLISVY